MDNGPWADNDSTVFHYPTPSSVNLVLLQPKLRRPPFTKHYQPTYTIMINLKTPSCPKEVFCTAPLQRGKSSELFSPDKDTLCPQHIRGRFLEGHPRSSLSILISRTVHPPFRPLLHASTFLRKNAAGISGGIRGRRSAGESKVNLEHSIWTTTASSVRPSLY